MRLTILLCPHTALGAHRLVVGGERRGIPARLTAKLQLITRRPSKRVIGCSLADQPPDDLRHILATINATMHTKRS